MGKRAEHETLHVRADSALIEGLDKIVHAEESAHPGRTITRADVIRELLHEGIRSRKGAR
jgi:hypothetical protein